MTAETRPPSQSPCTSSGTAQAARSEASLASLTRPTARQGGAKLAQCRGFAIPVTVLVDGGEHGIYHLMNREALAETAGAGV